MLLERGAKLGVGRPANFEMRRRQGNLRFENSRGRGGHHVPAAGHNLGRQAEHGGGLPPAAHKGHHFMAVEAQRQG